MRNSITNMNTKKMQLNQKSVNNNGLKECC